jgi:hypothetical protein
MDANFFNNITAMFSQAGQVLTNFKNAGIALTQSFAVPAPNSNDPFTLNRYSNDLREQSTEYQSEQLQVIKDKQTTNILLTVAAAATIVYFIKR